MNPPLLIDEQMPVKENNRSRPPKIFDIPKEISVLYTFEKRVPFYYSYMDDSNWINNPKNPHWNIKDIEIMMDHISKGHLHGAYGVKVSNDMTEIMKKYMIENIKDKHVLVIG